MTATTDTGAPRIPGMTPVFHPHTAPAAGDWTECPVLQPTAETVWPGEDWAETPISDLREGAVFYLPEQEDVRRSTGPVVMLSTEASDDTEDATVFCLAVPIGSPAELIPFTAEQNPVVLARRDLSYTRH